MMPIVQWQHGLLMLRGIRAADAFGDSLAELKKDFVDKETC